MPNRDISLVNKTIFSLIALLSVSILVSPGPLNPHPLSPSPPDALGPGVHAVEGNGEGEDGGGGES